MKEEKLSCLIVIILAIILLYFSGIVPTFNQMVNTFLMRLVISFVVAVLIVIFYFLSQR